MRIWFDTEFIEDGTTIDLISIGLVREDGEMLYLENEDCDLSRASEWVQSNVLPHLQSYARVSKSELAAWVRDFVGKTPEFWAYYASYDWVALCQLYGTMMDLPRGWPMFCRDVKQAMDAAGVRHIPLPNPKEHHALADAIWLRDAHFWLEQQGERAA